MTRISSETIDDIMNRTQIPESENTELKIDDDDEEEIDPLYVWNSTVENSTKIRRHEDVKPVYRLLV